MTRKFRIDVILLRNEYIIAEKYHLIHVSKHILFPIPFYVCQI